MSVTSMLIEGEANIIFFHNVPQSKGFSFVNIQLVAKLRQRPVLFEPVLDKRLCLLLRQSARWDLWSAGPETMPYPCPMNQDTFSIVEEKVIFIFSGSFLFWAAAFIQFSIWTHKRSWYKTGICRRRTSQHEWERLRKVFKWSAHFGWLRLVSRSDTYIFSETSFTWYL